MDGVGSSVSVASWHLHGVQVICISCDLLRDVRTSPIAYFDSCPFMEHKFAFWVLNVSFKALKFVQHYLLALFLFSSTWPHFKT